MILRPYGLIMWGEMHVGLEVEIEGGVVTKIGPHTAMPDGYVLSPAFVNAHSHLEYRGLLGRIEARDYLGFLREITLLKSQQSPEEIARDCALAAKENRQTGVARIGEHSDRPFAAPALRDAGIDGMLFQELITFLESGDPCEKIEATGEKLRAQAVDFSGESILSPHTPFTVDRKTLASFAQGAGFSIHVAESEMENEFFKEASGPIAEFYRSSGFPVEPTGKSSVGALDSLGLVREGAQFVHCCAINADDISLMAKKGATAVHCPRSNQNLGCPKAPIREMIDAGIKIGLGLDSAASSGPVDMFAEMRAALSTSLERGKPITPEEVWRMATDWGNESLPFSKPHPRWDLYVGSRTPLIKMALENAYATEDLIEKADPARIEWVIGF